VGVATVLAAACVQLAWDPLGPRRVAPVAGAEPVGTEECFVCHDAVQGHERIADYHADCESCHGPGSLHADSEDPEEIRFPANADCLRCHLPGRDTHLRWGTGDHSRAGLYCSDCHNPHATTRRHLRPRPHVAFPDMDAASRLCVDCHADVGSAQTFPSHHPVAEGALSCLSCHDPHEDSRTALGDANQRCYGCHQDVAGPWIFEHPPVVEDCAMCHDPHGAPTEYLLATIQPAICLSCHTLNDLWHHDVSGTGLPGNTTITQDRPTAPGERISRTEAGTFLRRCTDCHGAIHGSYTDEYLRH
jgi:DmsE family decaheme c-type cytochrome